MFRRIPHKPWILLGLGFLLMLGFLAGNFARWQAEGKPDLLLDLDARGNWRQGTQMIGDADLTTLMVGAERHRQKRCRWIFWRQEDPSLWITLRAHPETTARSFLGLALALFKLQPDSHFYLLASAEAGPMPGVNLGAMGHFSFDLPPPPPPPPTLSSTLQLSLDEIDAVVPPAPQEPEVIYCFPPEPWPPSPILRSTFDVFFRQDGYASRGELHPSIISMEPVIKHYWENDPDIPINLMFEPDAPMSRFFVFRQHWPGSLEHLRLYFKTKSPDLSGWSRSQP